MLAKISSKLSARDKKILIVLPVFVAIVLIYMAVFSWYLPLSKELMVEIDVIQNEVALLIDSQAKVVRLEESLNKSINKLNQEIDKFNWNVLKGEPNLVVAGVDAVRQIRLIAFKQNEVAGMGPILVLPISLAAYGSYDDIFNYLEYLDNQHKAIYINKLTIEAPFSYEQFTMEDVFLEVELMALGAVGYQSNNKPAASLITGMENIFEPTVNFSSGGILQQNTAGGSYWLDSGKEIITEPNSYQVPRYEFPDEEEIIDLKRKN